MNNKWKAVPSDLISGMKSWKVEGPGGKTYNRISGHFMTDKARAEIAAYFLNIMEETQLVATTEPADKVVSFLSQTLRK